MIAALYRRDLIEANRLYQDLSAKVLRGHRWTERSRREQLPIVADALGRMLARHCHRRHETREDCGFDLLEKALSPWPEIHTLTVPQAARLTMFFALKHYHKHEYDTARDRFRRVMGYGDDLGDPDLAPISRLYLGQAASKLENSDEAIDCYRNAIAKLREMRSAREPLIDVIRVLEVSERFWRDGALDRVESHLTRLVSRIEQFDDHATLGHVNSLLGRVSLRKGEYEIAERRLQSSVDLYSERDPDHRGSARVLMNLARAKMFQVRFSNVPERERARLLKGAERAIERAGEIYKSFDGNRKEPEVQTMRAELALDRGNVESALELAEQAEANAKERKRRGGVKSLNIDMSTAAILRCKCHLELTRLADKEGDFESIREHMNGADLAALDARVWADDLDHDRRTARAMIWAARVKIESPRYRYGEAKHDLKTAGKILPKSDQGYIREELNQCLQRLENRKAEKGNVRTDDVVYNVTAEDCLTDSPNGIRNVRKKIERAMIRYMTNKGLGRTTIVKELGLDSQETRNIIESFSKSLSRD